MSITLSALQQQRRDTAANWTSANPTLLAGEIGVETDTGLLKIGDGSTAWTSLDYLPLSFEGYAANGIYNPAANQVALATNGTGRLFIDSSGSVGIGTTSPSTQLHLVGSSASNYLRIDGSTGYKAFLGVQSGAAVIYAQSNTNGDAPIAFYTGSSERMRIDSSGNVGIGTTTPGEALDVNGTVKIGNTKLYSSGSGGTFDLRFQTYSGGFFDRVAITGAGNVGIGTSSPNKPLHIYSGSSDSEIRLQTNSGTEQNSYITLRESSGDLDFYTVASGTNMKFHTVNTERLRIDSSGNVGIGTTSATAKLDVNIGASSSDGLIVQSANDASVTGDHIHAYSARGSTDAYNLIKAENQTGVKFLVTGAGNVGIGTTNPGALLTVGSTSNSNTNATIASSTSGTGGLYFNDGANSGALIYDHTDNFLQFRANNTEQMRIDSSGNVGIGTSSVNQKLEVRDSSSPIMRIGDGTRHLEVHGGSTTQNCAIGTVYAGAFSFFTNGSSNERMRIDSSGRLLVGTSTARDDFFNSASTYSPILQVETSGSQDRFISLVYNDASENQSHIILGKTRGTTVGSDIAVQSGDGLGAISYMGADGSELVEAARIAAQVDGTPGSNDMPGRLVFSTTADGSSSPTERMRIKSNGDIGTFGASDALFVASSATASTSTNLILGKYSATTTFTGSTSFVVRTNGNVENTNNSYGSISDAKLKENIVDASSQWDDIKDLRVRNYNFIKGQTHTQIGVVAQEVETVSPGLVTESPDLDEEGNDLGTTTKSVNYSVLYMKAVKALQEAMERIETLEQRLTDAGL